MVSLPARTRWSFPATGASIPPLFGAILGLVSVVVLFALIELIRSSSAEDAAAIWGAPLAVTGVLLFGLFVFLAYKILQLGMAKGDRSAPRLHFRLVGFLSLAALVPAIISGVFLGFIVVNVVDNWFSARVVAAVDTSSDVMRQFLNDKLEDVQEEVRLMADLDLNKTDVAEAFQVAPVIYTSYLSQSALIRGFEALHIVDRTGNPVVRADLVPDRPMLPTQRQLAQADNGAVAWEISRQTGFVRLVYRLSAYPQHYAVVGLTLLDDETRALVDRAEAVVVDYREVDEGRRSAQFFMAQIFIQMTMLLVLGAVGYGLVVANRIMAPVDRLVMAARKVSDGELSVTVPVGEARNELTILEKAFNEMTGWIQPRFKVARMTPGLSWRLATRSGMYAAKRG